MAPLPLRKGAHAALCTLEMRWRHLYLDSDDAILEGVIAVAICPSVRCTVLLE